MDRTAAPLRARPVGIYDVVWRPDCGPPIETKRIRGSLSHEGTLRRTHLANKVIALHQGRDRSEMIEVTVRKDDLFEVNAARITIVADELGLTSRINQYSALAGQQ